jgi:Xaa-Pro aminopeptidase
VNHGKRLEALRGAGGVRADRVFVVSRPQSVTYFCGFRGSFGDLIVTTEGGLLVTDGRYALQAKRQAVGVDVRIGWQGEELLPAALGELDLPARCTVVLEGEGLSYGRWLALSEALPSAWTLEVSTGCVDSLRAVKDADEIAALRRVCAITDAAWADMQPDIRPGVSEKHVARRALELQLGHGADAGGHPIVASGPNSAFPHHMPTERVLVEGDLVKVDIGAVLDGYGSDLTRTVVLGEAPELARRMYRAVLEAQAAGLAAMCPGVRGEDADAAARKVIATAGFGEYFGHNLGHGLGQAKEPPHVAPGAVFQVGNVVTIEPGVYIEGVGGVRIEDVGVVTHGGFEVLSLAPKPLTLSNPG